MQNFITKGIFKSNELKIVNCELTSFLQKINAIHFNSTLINKIFSDLLIGVSLMGADLKEKQKLILTINHQNDLIVAEFDYKKNIRGFISVRSKQINLKNNCFLTVTKDYGLKKPYFSKIELEYDNVCDNLNLFFKKSEQLPMQIKIETIFLNNNFIKSGSGSLISVFPNYEQKDLKDLEKFIKKDLTKNDDINVVLKEEIIFNCGCSKEKFYKALSYLKKDELSDILNKDEKCECVCNYCLTKYNFDVEDLNEILKNKV